MSKFRIAIITSLIITIFVIVSQASELSDKDEARLGLAESLMAKGSYGEATEILSDLKKKYPDFIWNNKRTLELTLSENAKAVTDNCPSKSLVLPLYLQGDEFVTPFCCYGNDVDCDLCGAWVVFYLAARLEERNSWGDVS